MKEFGMRRSRVGGRSHSITRERETHPRHPEESRDKARGGPPQGWRLPPPWSWAWSTDSSADAGQEQTPLPGEVERTDREARAAFPRDRWIPKPCKVSVGVEDLGSMPQDFNADGSRGSVPLFTEAPNNGQRHCKLSLRQWRTIVYTMAQSSLRQWQPDSGASCFRALPPTRSQIAARWS